MDPLRFFKTSPSYIVVFGIILLIVACVCAYVELSKSGKAVDTTWRTISILAFIIGIILLLGIVMFSGYNKYCNKTILSDESKFTPSPGIELQ